LYFHWQGNFTVLLLLGVFVLGMVVFFIPSAQLMKPKEEKKSGSYLRIFQSRPLMLLIFHIVLMCAPYWIFVGILPLLYMKSCGVSLSHFGYYQGILALVFAFGSVLFGLMIHKADSRRFLRINIWFLFFLSILTLVLVVRNRELMGVR